MQKVYSKCFLFCDVYCENTRKIPVKYDTCIAGLTENIRLFLYKLRMLKTLSTLRELKCICFAKIFSVCFSTHQQNLPYIWFSEKAHLAETLCQRIKLPHLGK